MRIGLIIMVAVIVLAAACQSNESKSEIEDPLSSWTKSAVKTSIIEFVNAVTDPELADFVSEKDRIVVFDNDGTLWSEQPYYFQLQFTIDRIRMEYPNHPEWSTDTLITAVTSNDLKTVFQSGIPGLLKLVTLTHSGMTSTEFEGMVTQWIDSARHPVTQRLYKEMVYQPMLQLIDFFKENDFEVYIVSGGGIDFMRPWTSQVYGIEPQNVIGSSLKLSYEETEHGPVIRRLPELDFIDDGPGKPVGIMRHIGKMPIAGFGNSDGDLQMLQWIDKGNGMTLTAFLHHTDSVREWKYDRDSHVGKLNKGLEVAKSRDWLVIDMQNDWKTVYKD